MRRLRGQPDMTNPEYVGQPLFSPDAGPEAALHDVSVELSRVEALESSEVSSVAQLEQNLPELDYYGAELKSLRSSLLEDGDAERP